jgi:hypothetical protein
MAPALNKYLGLARQYAKKHGQAVPNRLEEVASAATRAAVDLDEQNRNKPPVLVFFLKATEPALAREYYSTKERDWLLGIETRARPPDPAMRGTIPANATPSERLRLFHSILENAGIRTGQTVLEAVEPPGKRIIQKVYPLHDPEFNERWREFYLFGFFFLFFSLVPCLSSLLTQRSSSFPSEIDRAEMVPLTPGFGCRQG